METNKETELELLFSQWCEEQKNEIEDNKTIPDGIEKNSFFRDGWIDYNAYCNSGKKILFVLKEPNIGKDVYKELSGEPEKRDQRGFYREFVYGDYNENTKQIGYWDNNKQFVGCDNRSKQKEKIARMAYCLLFNNEISNPKAKELQKALSQVAFMNINKRGGNSTTDINYLKNYFFRYKDNIKREIEIINPDIIVWCVDFEFDMEKEFPHIKVINMYHPAKARFMKKSELEIKDDREYIEKLKEYEDFANNSESLKLDMGIFKYMYYFTNLIKKI